MYALAVVVLSLAAREPAAMAMVSDRGFAACPAAIDAAASAPLFEGADGAARTAVLLIAWSYFESRWNPAAISPDGKDCGIMQIRGACTPALLTARGSYAAALAIMHRNVKHCGSIRGALSAYASGSCNAGPRVRAMVAKRCELAGGC